MLSIISWKHVHKPHISLENDQADTEPVYYYDILPFIKEDMSYLYTRSGNNIKELKRSNLMIYGVLKVTYNVSFYKM